MSERRFTIAIDGPSGAGKSTVARSLARRLGYAYLDTGAMYRAVAVMARRGRVDLQDEPSLVDLALSLRFWFPDRPDGGQGVVVNGLDLSNEIRSGQAGMDASRVSALPGVRQALTAEQRRLGAEGGVVMEGRDIGTVVLPNAEAKFFLQAESQERGRRRLRDLQARGEEPSLEDVVADLEKRDFQDSTRTAAPLRPAEDAIQVDSTRLNAQEVVEKMLAIIASLPHSTGGDS